MLEQQRFCHDGAQATEAQKFHQGDQQVDGEDEEFAHGANRTMTTNAGKTAPHRRMPSYCEFATDTREDRAFAPVMTLVGRRVPDRAVAVRAVVSVGRTYLAKFGANALTNVIAGDAVTLTVTGTMQKNGVQLRTYP
jgi:hypothetical protein